MRQAFLHVVFDYNDTVPARHSMLRQQRERTVRHLHAIGRIKKNYITVTTGPLHKTDALFRAEPYNGGEVPQAQRGNIFFQDLPGTHITFDKKSVRRSTAQRFNAKGSGSCKKIKNCFTIPGDGKNIE